MRANIPTALVDNAYEVFPKGTYVGRIDGAEVRDVKNDGSWITLKLELSGISAVEGTEDPGRTRFSSDLTISSDGTSLLEVTNWGDSNIPYGVRKSAGLLAGLAEGLGVAERGPNGVSADLAQVVEALTEGQFKGEQVAFEVDHYSPKNSDKTYDQFNRFAPAV